MKSVSYCSRLLGISPELIFIFLCCFQMCCVNDSLLCIPEFLRCAVAFECCGARAPFKQDIRIKCSIRDAVCLYLCLLPGFVVKGHYLFDMWNDHTCSLLTKDVFDCVFACAACCRKANLYCPLSLLSLKCHSDNNHRKLQIGSLKMSTSQVLMLVSFVLQEGVGSTFGHLKSITWRIIPVSKRLITMVGWSHK